MDEADFEKFLLFQNYNFFTTPINQFQTSTNTLNRGSTKAILHTRRGITEFRLFYIIIMMSGLIKHNPNEQTFGIFQSYLSSMFNAAFTGMYLWDFDNSQNLSEYHILCKFYSIKMEFCNFFSTSNFIQCKPSLYYAS